MCIRDRAAWYSDLEEKTDWNAYEEMYYWNETRGEWVYWCESWMPYPPKPSPTPIEIIIPINVTTKQVTVRWCEGPWMEPGDVVKVKYVIRTEASCKPGDYSWTLYLGWE